MPWVDLLAKGDHVQDQQTGATGVLMGWCLDDALYVTVAWDDGCMSEVLESRLVKVEERLTQEEGSF